MELEGTFEDGKVVVTTDHPVPDGTKAFVRVVEVPGPPRPTVWERMRQLAEECEKLPCDLPEDFAINHDHYLYGTPKRQ